MYAKEINQINGNPTKGNKRECVKYLLPGAYKGKERISHIDTMVLSKNKVTLADSHSC